MPPPKQFSSAAEHYKFLLDRAHGGTKHSLTSLPDWSGIWQSGITTMSMRHPVDAPCRPHTGRATSRSRKRSVSSARCIRPAHTLRTVGVSAMARRAVSQGILAQPETVVVDAGVHERDPPRLYRWQTARHAEGNTWLGDSIGFWDGDKLVVWTMGVKAADYLRGYPDNSAELEGIEVWQRVNGANGRPDRIVVQATMYDPVGLTAPWNVATSYVKADYEHRIRYWDCALTSNDVKDASGRTTSVLPGEAGYKKPQTEVTRPSEGVAPK